VAVDDVERISFRCPRKLKKRIATEARKNNISVNSYLIAAADFATKNLVFFAAAPTAPELPAPPKGLPRGR
jgi:hypothetical protein